MIRKRHAENLRNGLEAEPFLNNKLMMELYKIKISMGILI
jgi:hypothetical protein